MARVNLLHGVGLALESELAGAGAGVGARAKRPSPWMTPWPGPTGSWASSMRGNTSMTKRLPRGERAIALDPNNADGYALQASVLLFAGRSEDALRSIEQAMRLNPHYPAWYLQQLGAAYQQTGRYAEAITAYKQLLVRNPNFLWAYVNLAFSYLAQWVFQLSQDPQTLEQALEAAQQAVALNGSLPQAHAVLGYVYLVQKQYE